MLHDTSFSIAQAAFSFTVTLPPLFLLTASFALHFSVPDFSPLCSIGVPNSSAPYPLWLCTWRTPLFIPLMPQKRVYAEFLLRLVAIWDLLFSSGACGAQRSHCVAKFSKNLFFCFFILVLVFSSTVLLQAVLLLLARSVKRGKLCCFFVYLFKRREDGWQGPSHFYACFFFLSFPFYKRYTWKPTDKQRLGKGGNGWWYQGNFMGPSGKGKGESMGRRC